MANPKLLRVTTVPISLHLLLHGQLKFMQNHGFELLTVSAEGPEVNEITKQGIRHTVVSFTRKITPVRDFFCLLRLIWIILKFKPDIVHSHTPKAGLLGMLAARVCRVRIRMHTIAGLPLTEARGFKKFILKIAERITYSCSTSVYPNSIGLKNHIINELKIKSSKFEIIGNGSSNGIDLDHYKMTDDLKIQTAEMRSQFGIDSDDYVFCFVGRVVRDKGIVELVNSFISIAKIEKSVWLLLVGHFEEELDPLPKAIKLEILNHPRIIHSGFQEDIRPWVLLSDVFVLPSYREGFPNVVLQAGSLERPSIVSDINGCNEIIENERTGLLVPPKNIEALKAAMIYFLQNRQSGYRMGVNGRQFIATRFDQLYIWNEIVKEYKKRLSTCI